MENTEKKEIKEKLTISVMKGEEVSSRDVEYAIQRLSYGKKKELRKQANILEYAEIDLTEMDEKGNPKFKALDMKAWMEKKEEAEDQVTLILWGIKDLTIDQIVANDFDQMLLTVREKDALDFKKDEEQTKKNIVESKLQQINSTTSLESSMTK